ncbi:MAG TPA: ABC transporter permease [Clostridiaceae bacterium]|nr:ABC transporter permease [Clostridiaceae bacterium]
MQVFKLCLKVLKKNIPTMLIYIVVFLVVSLIMSSALSKEMQADTLFAQKKSNMAFISEESSPLIDGLKQELSKVANFVELPDEKEALQDALYFRSVSYILRIPEGFTESFMKGENVRLKKTTVPNSYSNTYIDLSINKYLNNARLYVRHIENISQESLVQHLKSDLSVNTSVELKNKSDKVGKHIYANYFFNYMSYSLLSVLILGMTALMLVFYNNDLRRRNACSPLSARSINLQFILASLLFTVITWMIMVAFCILYNWKNSFNLNTVYFMINSLVFAFCGASISFLIGNLVKSANAISAVTNVVTLGLCFISGVFVPLELLGDSVLKVASFTPTYWFVTGNNRIAKLAQFNHSDIEPVLSCMLIQLGFALAFFAVALVINKKRRFQ